MIAACRLMTDAVAQRRAGQVPFSRLKTYSWVTCGPWAFDNQSLPHRSRVPAERERIRSPCFEASVAPHVDWTNSCMRVSRTKVAVDIAAAFDDARGPPFRLAPRSRTRLRRVNPARRDSLTPKQSAEGFAVALQRDPACS